jgi:IS5 family transposase
MVGLFMLKHLQNLRDERVVDFWSLSPYAQFFCGEREMQWGVPCESSELVHFRNRIGPGGAEKIFASTIELHGETAKENGVALRQSFERTVPKLLAAQRGRRHKNGAQSVRKATRRLKTIAWRVVRQLDKGLDANAADRSWLEVAKRILKQKKGDSQKVYSLHEPEVYCLSKGKEHKKYELGAKASVVVGKTHGVILGAYSLPENDYDGHTLDPALQQVERIAMYRPKVAIADRGYRGKSKCGETEILTPKPPKKDATNYEKRKARQRFRRRSAIEPRIGHLKSDFRLSRCHGSRNENSLLNILADGGGFEPPIPCGIHAFQASAIDHSATHPTRRIPINRRFERA